MDLEQTVKDLQTQNMQFQQLLTTLAKGQEELKTLFAKEKKKKEKKPTGVVITGRRFQGHTRRTLNFQQHLMKGKGKGKGKKQ